MSFTTAEKAAIRQYLGFSELFKDLDARLEGQFDEIGTRSPDAETRVRNNLTKLAAVDSKIDAIMQGTPDVTKADEGEFDPTTAVETLQNYGRTLIRQIAVTFLLEPLRDYYGAGDAGGPIPLG